jgi:hypothetical protein
MEVFIGYFPQGGEHPRVRGHQVSKITLDDQTFLGGLINRFVIIHYQVILT